MAAAFASAQSFNIDFANISVPGTAPASTYGAVGTAGFWNTPLGAPTNFALLDLAGQLTTALYSATGQVGIDLDPPGFAAGNARWLMEDFFNGATSQSISLTGLQTGFYQVILYAKHTRSVQGGSFTINSNTQSTTGANWNGNFVQGVNYTVFNDLQVNNGTLNISFTGVANGMQLQHNPVPEPATLAALGFGALALVKKRRRRTS